MALQLFIKTAIDISQQSWADGSPFISGARSCEWEQLNCALELDSVLPFDGVFWRILTDERQQMEKSLDMDKYYLAVWK